MKGIIFDVQRFSLHDGPGIRTTVFMKGCPLRCPWCHNPEGLSGSPDVQFFTDECIGCGRCGGIHTKEKAAVCPTGAIKSVLRSVSPEELFKELISDREFFGGGGGVTFSGGECLLQADFLAEAMSLLKKEGIGIAVDTSGAVPYSNFLRVLPYVDCFLYDIKCYSEEKHERVIGRSNREIIENLYSLSKEGKDIYVRVPVIPDFNDTPEELEKIAGLISSLENVKEVTLIPYHTLGKSKYETLGLSPRYETDRRITESELSKFRKIFENLGIDVN